MHIMEGFLPPAHAAAWGVAALPFVVYGVYSVRKVLKQHPESRMLLGAAAGFSLVLSSLKIPSFSGSCSHPTGIGLGTMLFGPGVMIIVGMVVLLFQALFLAHGGLTTLGANLFSMAVVGSFVGFGCWRLMTALRCPRPAAVFMTAFLADLSAYAMTTCQLALAFPDVQGGFTGSLIKFGSIFVVTQIPIAFAEGLLTVFMMNMLEKFVMDEPLLATFFKRGQRT